MSPREFIAAYGRPTPITVAVPNVGTVTIPADPDRYVLTIWASSGVVSITPGEDDPAAVMPFTFGPGQTPFTLSHSHVGGVVNLAFRVASAGIGVSLTYIVGRMTVPPGRRKVIVPYGRSGGTERKSDPRRG